MTKTPKETMSIRVYKESHKRMKMVAVKKGIKLIEVFDQFSRAKI